MAARRTRRAARGTPTSLIVGKSGAIALAFSRGYLVFSQVAHEEAMRTEGNRHENLASGALTRPRSPNSRYFIRFITSYSSPLPGVLANFVGRSLPAGAQHVFRVS